MDGTKLARGSGTAASRLGDCVNPITNSRGVEKIYTRVGELELSTR